MRGWASAWPIGRSSRRLERVRPPGSVSTISAHVAALALRSPEYALANVATLSAEREWLAARPGGARLATGAQHHQLPAGARSAITTRPSDAADGLLRAGIVPRTFGPANPLRGHLRLTVRSRPENERLLDAVERLAR